MTGRVFSSLGGSAFVAFCAIAGFLLRWLCIVVALVVLVPLAVVTLIWTLAAALGLGLLLVVGTAVVAILYSAGCDGARLKAVKRRFSAPPPSTSREGR